MLSVFRRPTVAGTHWARPRVGGVPPRAASARELRVIDFSAVKQRTAERHRRRDRLDAGGDARGRARRLRRARSRLRLRRRRRLRSDRDANNAVTVEVQQLRADGALRGSEPPDFLRELRRLPAATCRCSTAPARLQRPPLPMPRQRPRGPRAHHRDARRQRSSRASSSSAGAPPPATWTRPTRCWDVHAAAAVQRAAVVADGRTEPGAAWPRSPATAACCSRSSTRSARRARGGRHRDPRHRAPRSTRSRTGASCARSPPVPAAARDPPPVPVRNERQGALLDRGRAALDDAGARRATRSTRTSCYPDNFHAFRARGAPGPVVFPNPITVKFEGASPVVALRSSEETVAIGISEELLGDLNADTDASDLLLSATDLPSGLTTDTGQAIAQVAASPARPVVAVGDDIVAFLESEALSANTDLNGDGETDDLVMRVLKGADAAEPGRARRHQRRPAARDRRQPARHLGGLRVLPHARARHRAARDGARERRRRARRRRHLRPAEHRRGRRARGLRQPRGQPGARARAARTARCSSPICSRALHTLASAGSGGEGNADSFDAALSATAARSRSPRSPSNLGGAGGLRAGGLGARRELSRAPRCSGSRSRPSSSPSAKRTWRAWTTRPARPRTRASRSASRTTAPSRASWPPPSSGACAFSTRTSRAATPRWATSSPSTRRSRRSTASRRCPATLADLRLFSVLTVTDEGPFGGFEFEGSFDLLANAGVPSPFAQVYARATGGAAPLELVSAALGRRRGQPGLRGAGAERRRAARGLRLDGARTWWPPTATASPTCSCATG